ncbi:MAG: tetratricopeptide repeat protein [Balneolaceae bacterium]
MTLRKIVLGISVLVLMGGCKTSMQSNWRDFNAYYNTYYNAKKSYNSGLKKNLNQVRQYNPLQPIRIHEKPVNAGAQDFDKAIQKGADVLRRYEDTKWVDDALALIGKSYYFKQEYFSADQKFKELYLTTQNPSLQQQSILWQGRVLLDLEAYNEGVAFLTEELTVSGDEWEAGHRAEIKALLAQHHVKLENWQLAANELSEALPDLQKKDYRERGYFLLGQIYEQLGNTETAYEAYNQVQKHYVEYRVQYLAQRKKAEVARSLGRIDVAYRIFNDMVRDDKNLEYKAELDFELARTEHERGNYQRAEQLYKDVLHNNLRQPAPEIAARSYNGLAEIYRYWYDDFSMAAAYYDSAAQKNVSADKLPEDFEAGELAESFGSYARIRSEIALQDSLLKLGQLSPQEFDSVLVILKEKKLAELEKLREQQEEQQNQIVTVNNEEEDQSATNLRNGFLNSNNPVIQENARQQFFAIWGDRPLADKWRVRSMIEYTGVSGDENGNENGVSADANSGVMSVQIDLSRIPFTPEDQDSVRERIAAYQYELGNLFFLSLNNPDSAVYYFEMAIENPSVQNVNTVSMYSLSELYSIQENEEKARYYAQQLIEQYPNTEYARRVSVKFNIPLTQDDDWDTINPLQLYMQISLQDTIEASQKAKRLETFAHNYTDHKIAPQALYESINWYMVAGKEDSVYKKNISEWRDVNQEWNQKITEFKVKQDTASSMLQDTTLTEEKRIEFQALRDSTLQEPDFTPIFPYRGAYWDSARAVADTFMVMFRDSKFRSKVSRLQSELTVPSEKMEEVAFEEEQESQIAENEEGYYKCQDLNTELEIRGGLQDFISNLNLPNNLGVDEITYLFKVNSRGIIDEYVLQTNEVPEEISREFERAFPRMNFEPVMNEGQAVAAECLFTFSIEN